MKPGVGPVPASCPQRTRNTLRRRAMAETMKADQAVFLLQNVYLGPLKNESRTTKKILEAVPADKGEYRPEPAARSAIELVRLIAAADNRFVETVINGVFDTSPAMIPDNVKTPGEIAPWHDKRLASNYEPLPTISGDRQTTIGDFRATGQRPAVR